MDAAFADSVNLFAPLLRAFVLTSGEEKILSAQQIVGEEAREIPVFNPSDNEDGRAKTLREVAVRQGQAKFRERLVEAYDGVCAITRCSILAALQAAHITPYRGPHTNSVQNGLLLRADINNLFDLGLIQIHPESLEVQITTDLIDTEYADLRDRKVFVPTNSAKRPSKAALEEHRLSFA